MPGGQFIPLHGRDPGPSRYRKKGNTDLKEWLKLFRAAFPHTIPILTSFLLVGMAYGVFANSKGLPVWFPTLMSLVIFAGSMEFVTVSLLCGTFHPLSAFLMALMVNARYFFYGISMLEPFRNIGKKKYYMIYAMCDETFSLNLMVKPPEEMDKGRFMLAITILNQSYWVLGATLGSILGAVLPFDSRGIDFILTALYVTIFLDQWGSTKAHVPALTGLIASVGALIIFGSDTFVLIAMVLIVVVLLLGRKWLQKEDGGQSA